MDAFISIVNVPGSIMVYYAIFILDQNYILRVRFEPATDGLQYYTLQCIALPTEL